MTSWSADNKVPHLNNTYLKKLNEKPADWLQELNDELAAVKADGIDVSAFEKAVRASKGKPFVFDDGNTRSLHFDQRMMQSAMAIDAPDELTFGYTKAMMGFLLANEAPEHILMIGLGGGSLAKFCYAKLAGTRITVVEIDADVIALRDQFCIPPDDDRLQIVHMDAVDFIEQHHHQYDVILLDGFDADGIVSDLLTEDFLSSCQKSLNQNGMLVTNMWGKSKRLITMISRMSHIFEDPVWWCHSSDSYNLITFAFKTDATVFTADLSEKARRLDKSYWLGLGHLANRIRQIPGRSLDWVLAPGFVQFSLKHFFFQEAVEAKVKYFFAVDEMITVAGRLWLEPPHSESDKGLSQIASRE